MQIGADAAECSGIETPEQYRLNSGVSSGSIVNFVYFLPLLPEVCHSSGFIGSFVALELEYFTCGALLVHAQLL
jgi:hypothetical protein